MQVQFKVVCASKFVSFWDDVEHLSYSCQTHLLIVYVMFHSKDISREVAKNAEFSEGG